MLIFRLWKFASFCWCNQPLVLIKRHVNFGGLMTDKRRHIKNIVELYSSYNTEAGYLSMKIFHFEKVCFNFNIT